MFNWQAFERLAEQIYRELNDVAEVRWNDQIYGRDSEIQRQIDVSIRWDDAGHQRLAIVQAKDWKARADVTTVGEFASVIRDVRADQGVLVCKGGFSKQAVKYARNIGIQLHNLHDAQSKNWQRNLTIPILWTEQLPGLNFEGAARFEAGDTLSPTDIGFVDLGGAQRDFHEQFIERWNSGELDRTPSLIHPYNPGGRLIVRVDRPDGTVAYRPTRSAQLSYIVEQKSWLGQFEPSICRGYIDYLADEAFVASHLPVGEVPTVRDEKWTPITDPKRVAVNIVGSFVTTEHFQVRLQGAQGSLRARYLGP